MQIKLFEQLLDRDVINVFTVEVDQASVDEETFLKSLNLDKHWHLFLHHKTPPKFFIQGFLHKRAAYFINWLAVTLLKPLIVAEVLVLRPLHDAL